MNSRSDLNKSLASPLARQWLIIAVAAVAAYYAKRAFDAAKKQAEAAQDMLRLTHRPKLIVRKIAIPGIDTLNTDRTPMKDIANVMQGWYEVANIGGMAATITTVVEGIHTGTHPPMERPDANEPGRQLGKKIAAGEACKIDFGPVILSEHDEMDIMFKRSEAFFLLIVEYIDESGINRVTSACREFDRKTRCFVAIENPDYEFAD